MRVYNCYVTDSRLNLTKASPLYPSGYAPSGSSLASALRLIKFIKFRPMPRRPLDIVSLLDHGIPALESYFELSETITIGRLYGIRAYIGLFDVLLGSPFEKWTEWTQWTLVQQLDTAKRIRMPNVFFRALLVRIMLYGGLLTSTTKS